MKILTRSRGVQNTLTKPFLPTGHTEATTEVRIRPQGEKKQHICMGKGFCAKASWEGRRVQHAGRPKAPQKRGGVGGPRRGAETTVPRRREPSGPGTRGHARVRGVRAVILYQEMRGQALGFTAVQLHRELQNLVAWIFPWPRRASPARTQCRPARSLGRAAGVRGRGGGMTNSPRKNTKLCLLFAT